MNSLLDTIALDDGTILHGVVDYVTSKHVYFFDFTKGINPDYIILTILWKGSEYHNKRFSVYCLLVHPRVILPRVILIPTAHIVNSNRMIYPRKKNKQKKMIIKDRLEES